jgi:hypothetical protein
LLLLAGELCGLLAIASFDLGDNAAASTHARAAWGYGEHIGHNSLRAWAKGTQALIAYWDDRPLDAVRLAQAGRSYLAAGTGAVRLCLIEARAWSHLGNGEESERALQDASGARESGLHDDLHDGVGGEFAYGEGRQARCRSTVYVQLGDANKALAEADHALALFSNQRNIKIVPEVYADQVAAHLIKGQADGAQEALDRIVDLPVEQRINGLVTRLDYASAIAEANERLHSSSHGGRLVEQIRAFTAFPAQKAITSGGSVSPLPPPAA